MAKILPKEFNIEKRTPKTNVKVDWKAYFYKFCQVHGDPIQHKNVLIFEDGWRYPVDKYEGPEVPPPNDPEELIKLRLTYWYRRRGIVRYERDVLASHLDGLRNLQDRCSLPLQQSRVDSTVDEDTGEKVVARRTFDIDFPAMEGRLNWLIEDFEICEQAIATLKREVTHLQMNADR